MGWSGVRRAKANPDVRLGDRVRLIAGPWAGREGIYIENRPGVHGTRRVILLDDGDEAFVTRPAEQWERVTKKAA
jgi:transcription antitermination factor NusG